jgi:NodT family efflux transporter outer membrane factor (OMF) lipoprotein
VTPLAHRVHAHEAYAQLRGFQRRLEIANKNIKTQQETLDLTSARAKAGLANELDVSRAAAQLESTKAVVPTLLSGIDVSIHRLSVLLGEEPGALRSELEKTNPIPSAGPEVDVGLPSDLLKRRPDIRRSEAQLAAATARIGEAKADLFPRFVLTGTAGRQAAQLHDLTLGAGNFFSVGPGISLPLFTGGRIRSNIAVQTSRQREAVIGYQSTVLNALEEGRERPGQLFARTGAPRPAQRCGSAQPVGRRSSDRAIQSRSRRFFVGVGCTARSLRKRRSARTKSDVCHHQSGWTVSRLGRGLESGANRSHEQVDTRTCKFHPRVTRSAEAPRVDCCSR